MNIKNPRQSDRQLIQQSNQQGDSRLMLAASAFDVLTDSIFTSPVVICLL